MTVKLPPITKAVGREGRVEYHFWADQTWDGFDSLVKYIEKHWDGVVIESVDNVYSRRWVLRSGGVSISVYHDGQDGNYFVREDGEADQSLLEAIEADLQKRLA
ncbi:hypothetical protein [Dyella sedimenti]|uniref:hypothetical protein n=1 Tax=Dyella sedimenti TaxID=2919947 RepID=UPI001FAABC56|nr:hypothetical protein [Dyella sedimenti]